MLEAKNFSSEEIYSIQYISALKCFNGLFDLFLQKKIKWNHKTHINKKIKYYPNTLIYIHNLKKEETILSNNFGLSFNYPIWETFTMFNDGISFICNLMNFRIHFCAWIDFKAYINFIILIASNYLFINFQMCLIFNMSLTIKLFFHHYLLLLSNTFLYSTSMHATV